jgi:hypothetical protein
MNWPQKNTKDHKENKQSKFLSLRSFAAKILPKMKSFFWICNAKGARGNGPCQSITVWWPGLAPAKSSLRLGSAISRIHSFLTKLFHHEEHEGHEVLNMPNCTIFLRVLRVLRGEHWVAGRRAVSLRVCVEVLAVLLNGSG